MATSDSGAQIYVFDTCLDANTCLANKIPDGAGSLYFTAPTAGTYTVMVDSSSSFASAAFTLDWRLIPGAICTPSTTRCDGASTVALCDDSALSETLISCFGACVNGYCEAPTATIDACVTAPSVTEGIFKLNFTDLDDTIDIPSSGCVGTQTDGPDAFFSVAVPAGEVLTVEVNNASTSFSEEALLYIIEDCTNPTTTCLAGGKQTLPKKSATISWVNPDMAARTVIVGVDNESAFANEEFTLAIATQPVECPPNDPSATGCLNASTLEYCSASGLFESYACQGNMLCSGVSCDQPSGEVCVDSVALNPGGATSGTLTGTYSGSQNDVQIEAGITGSCSVGSGDASDGGDQFYSVDLNAGDLLDLQITTSDSGAQLYIFENCLDLNSCLTNKIPDGAGSLSFFAQSPGTYTVMVDSSLSFASAAFTLDWQITSGIFCLPDSFFCLDPFTAAVCSSDGLTTLSTSSCATGCTDGGCDVVTAQVNTCSAAAAAAPVGDVSYRLDPTTLSNDIDLPSSSCTGTQSDGPDAFFSVVVPDGEALVVSTLNQDGSSSSEVLLYVFDSCANPQGTCREGIKQASGTRDTELVVPNASGAPVTWIVGVDNENSSASGAVFVSISTRPLDCIPGDLSSTSCFDASTLQYCNADGEFESYACQGNMLCSGVSCDQPSGEVCVDSVALNPGGATSGTLTGTYSGSQNDVQIEAGITGSCSVGSGDASDGGDQFYSVDLNAGDLLDLQITTSDNGAQLYVFENCLDLNSCLANKVPDGAGSLSFFAASSGTYTVMVDSSLSNASAAFTLDWQITSGLLCLPDSRFCLDPFTAAVCSSDGLTTLFTSSCATGCTDGGCDVVTAQVDTCSAAAAAAPVGDVSYRLDPTTLSNDIDLPSSSCTGTQSDGPDAFFSVVVPNGEALVVSTSNQDLSSASEVLLYVFDSCADAQGTCQEGIKQASGTQDTELVVPNASGAPVTWIVGVDNENSSASGAVFVSISTRLLDCIPGDLSSTSCFDASTLQYCNADGEFETYPCGGNMVCSGARCDQPQGDICADAIAINSAGQTMGTLTGTYDMAVGTNSLTVPSGTSGACYVPLNDHTDWTDTFYSVELVQGEVLSLDLKVPNTVTEYMFVFSDCSSLNQCLSNTSDGQNGLDTFVAPATGTYYIVVDSWSSFISESFTLNWSIDSTSVCPPDEFYCVDPNTAARCDATGTGPLIISSCVNGCSQGACNVQESAVDLCAMTMTNIGFGASLNIEYDLLTDDLDMSSPNCTTTATDGPDAFFLVDVPAGQTLTAGVFEEYITGTAILYVIDNCMTAATTNSCLVGQQSNTALITWTNTTGAAKQVILGVDNTSPSARGLIRIAAGVAP